MGMRALLIVLVAATLAGCASGGAGTANFSLKPERIGWFAGDEARFTLTIEESLLRDSPRFILDRQFAIEVVELSERGVRFGGDFETRDPDALALRLVRDGQEASEVVLDKVHPSVDLYVTLPAKLRDSEYILEIKLFQVGWVRSEPFRVDHDR